MGVAATPTKELPLFFFWNRPWGGREQHRVKGNNTGWKGTTQDEGEQHRVKGNNTAGADLGLGKRGFFFCAVKPRPFLSHTH